MYIVLSIISNNFVQNNNKDETFITSSRDALKSESGCTPREKWNIMELGTNAVKIVCNSKDYMVDHEPKEIALNPILLTFKHSTIVDIDEKKNTITMDFRLVCIWRDERIKAIFSKNFGIIMLSPVTTEEKPTIWNPFNQLQIWRLKERRYILDPIVSQIGLASSNTANDILNSASEINLFPANTSVVFSQIDWKATVTCSFDFSVFPFDRQQCRVGMSLPFNWNLTVHSQKKYVSMYHAGGFYISVNKFGSFKHYDAQLDFHSINFGIAVDTKR